jgi:hypothetical protein
MQHKLCNISPEPEVLITMITYCKNKRRAEYLANAIRYPGAVMVKLLNTAITCRAMFRKDRSKNLLNGKKSWKSEYQTRKEN